jgi:hypothetical protein
MSGEYQEPSPALKALSDIMGLYGKDMGSFEAGVWVKIIREFGDDAVIQFLSRHAQTSVFAPKPADIMQALMPGRATAQAALEELIRAVNHYGPYRSPKLRDRALAEAILILGGWVRVNELLPDPVNRFEFDDFSKRFDLCYRQACARLMVSEKSTEESESLRVADAQHIKGLHALKNAAVQRALGLGGVIAHGAT